MDGWMDKTSLEVGKHFDTVVPDQSSDGVW